MLRLGQRVFVGCITGSILALASTARASYISDSPLMPSPAYDHTVPPRKCYPTATPICVDSFFDVFPELQRVPGPPPGSQRIDSFFDIFTELTLDGGSGPQTYSVAAQMAMRTVAAPSPPPGTAIYETEMLQMDLVGGTLPQGMRIRESPTLPSMGQTTISDIGGGLYHIDSFFDIFTELSLDDGQSWIAADNPLHMVGRPEPGTLALLSLGMLALMRRRMGR